MKKLINLLMAAIILAFPISAQAFENNVKLNAGLPRLTSFEYERKLNNVFPNLSAFVNYGSGEFDLNSEKTTISGLGLGARYRLPFLGYIGIGYGTLNVDYAYVQSVGSGDIGIGETVNVSGKFTGLLIEYGNDIRLGPVLIGGSIGYISGSPDISAEVNQQNVNSEDVNSGAATIAGVPQASFYIGFAF
jgi:hypothetical protein